MDYKKINSDTFFPSIKEEIANSVTHGIGIILSIIALSLLIYRSALQGSIRHLVCCSCYGSSLIILYTSSTLYHAITNKAVKNILRRLDHISIFLLIFGTYMPLTLVALSGAFGWVLFGIECGCCLIGILFKAIFGTKFAVVSALFYLLMGWLAIFAWKPMYTAVTEKGALWILFGGIFYTLGIIFFATDKKVPYFHAIWHIFVLIGSFCHFLTILLYVNPVII